MWDSRLVSVKDNLIGDFSVSIEIEMNSEIRWWFSAVYGPCKPKDRNLFWNELVGLRVICGERWCVGGDFNVVRSLSEKLNSLTITNNMMCFDILINELELHDLPLLNAKYTWSNSGILLFVAG